MILQSSHTHHHEAENSEADKNKSMLQNILEMSE